VEKSPPYSSGNKEADQGKDSQIILGRLPNYRRFAPPWLRRRLQDTRCDARYSLGFLTLCLGAALAAWLKAGHVNTVNLYNRNSRLVNVRLDQERLREACLLREKGFALSDVIREAIDERFAELNLYGQPREVSDIVNGIFEQYPDPDNIRSRSYDIHDSKAARAAIREKLRRRLR
jgi:hypothetical protein